MPYFPGYTLTDSVGNPLTMNGGADLVQEPSLSVSGLVAQIAAVGNVVGPAGVQGTVEDIATTLGAPEETATIAGDIAAIAAVLAPVAIAVLDPAVGLGVVALAVLDAVYGLSALQQQEQSHYNYYLSNGVKVVGADPAYWDSLETLVEALVSNYATVSVNTIMQNTDSAYSTQAIRNALTAMNGDIGSDLEDIKASLAALDLLGAPTWPGEDNVTLGTPVALAPAVSVEEACHGVIVNLTGAPTKTSVWLLGSKNAYGALGQIAFVSDRGDAETWQWLQFGQQVYCPKTMRQAAGAILRCPTDAVGTVTPWVYAAP